ncbi:bifunctional riboflavin kinase/FAD synthetase [Paenibacillus alkaliterrae]|uniref:bifunctional riboflavin kinase/FAD synthetase n=1 Tax=Paenibacillus alkaliterrae TaxID=320909 RepID=UPI001F01AA01|nr:bifunctional riboflavin kinase/FAD synthetase [Paenibacillus alkaliterrae]MCF2937054.1 bifunctional riboflavin kinase/FAD synthetase [Paenibacillus alkaliterrae]
MEIIPLSYPLNGLSTLSLDKPLSIAIGHFDGVHRGHQNVIRQAVREAKEADLLSAVLTFDPHPKEVLGQGDQYYHCLTPLNVKMALFAELGIDLVFIMRFNTEFAAVSPKRFVDEVLRTLRAKQVVVGFDFNFGHRGEGDTEALKQLGQPDIAVHVVEPLFENGIKVSSTYVRESLEQGDLKLAERLLGRLYEVAGTVVHGDGRGRTIGFPTANLHFKHPYIAPRLGVYAITAWIGDVAYPGVLNHGLKPTFNKQEVQPVMEAHLFDFNGDIYGEQLRIQFRSFIRSERKFNSINELVKQIEADSLEARNLAGLH